MKHQWSNVINLGYEAFPIPWHYEITNWRRCREFQNQLLPPLLACPVIEIEKIQNLLERLGWFLNDEGKLNEAEVILGKAKVISIEVNGEGHADMLRTMANLAETYRNQGWRNEAVALEEEVLKA
jgi:hypothetical protein